MKPFRKSASATARRGWGAPRLAAVVAVAAVLGCQTIVGVEPRSLDPVLTTCILPPTGAAKLRFADLVPDDDAVDVCVRQTGSAYARPLLRGAGTGCAKELGTEVAGFKYPDVSAPFGGPAGKIDVKVVAAGQTCSGAPLTEASGLDVVPGSTTTIARIGNEKGATIKAFRDDPEKGSSSTSKFRFIHAAPGLPAIDWAFTSLTSLPADLEQQLIKVPMPFGTATTSATPIGVGKINALGYIEIPGTKLNIGAAPTGTKKAILLVSVEGRESGRTIYAVGDPSKPFFQVRALVCNDLETAGLHTSCKLTNLGTISVDLVSAFLIGGVAADEDERRSVLFDTVAARDSDLVCVDAVRRQADRDLLISKAKAKSFPYSYQFKTDLTTKLSDPRDQSGVTPRPYDTPACATDPMRAEAAIQCVQDNCSTTHTADGRLAGGTKCASSACAAKFIPLLTGTREQKRCHNCLSFTMSSLDTHANMRDKCINQSLDYKAFDGQNDSLILSKFPLSNTDTFVLPNTNVQRVVHSVKAEIEKGKFIDFYCAVFSTDYGDLLPYYGNYAPAPGNPYYQEQLLQAQRLLEYVKKRSGTNPALIAGDFAASAKATGKDGKTVSNDQNGVVFAKLEEGNFFPMLPKEFVPRCTTCATNPYAVVDLWTLRTYAFNLPASSGVEVSYFATELDAVTTTDGRKVPMSDTWGYATSVLRP